MAHTAVLSPATPASLLFLGERLPEPITALAHQCGALPCAAAASLAAAAQAIAASTHPVVVLVPGLDPTSELALLRAGAAECLEARGITSERLVATLGRAVARLERQDALRLAAGLLGAVTHLENSTVVAFDATLTIRYASAEIRELLGYDPAALVGTSVTDHVTPESLPQAMEYVQAAADHPGEPLAFTVEARLADGACRQVSGQVVNLLAHPVIGAMVVLIRGPEADRRSRQQLESDRVFRELADQAPVHIWIEDATRRLTWENRTALEFTGRSFAEEEGYGWLETVHPEERAMVERHYRETTMNQRGFTLEFRMRRFDGAWRHVLQIAIPRWDTEGVFIGFLGVDVDITDLREASARVEQAEARYRLFVEQSTEGIWRFEVSPPVPLDLGEEEMLRAIMARSSLAECNQAMARQYGVEDPTALIGLRLGDLLSSAAPANEVLLRQFIRGGFRLSEAESVERDREGRRKVFLNNFIGIIDQGHLVRAWGTQRDITVQRQLEEEARQSRKMETAGRLAGGIAHDFNNLLTAILGTSEMLLMELDAGTSAREDVEEIKRAATRAANLTRQLLAFSRRQVLQPRTLDLNQLVHGVQTMLRRLIGEHITLETAAAAADLWRVRADPGQLEQVVVNLCVNARDAMPTGGRLLVETANVHFPGARAGAEAIMPAGAYVLLTVSDSGTGMDAETLRHIFEPFFTTKETGRGTGLGLATVYGIVKQSGGYIYVDTEPGRGSRFRIYLPRVEGTPDAGESPVEPARERATGTLLLVEDEEAVRRLARRVLQEVGYTVLEAENGAEALRLVQRWEGDIDLVVTDVIMPGMSGQELSSRLRVERPWLRILYVSGYTDDAILQHGTLLPNTTFLQKPFTPGALLQRVADAMR